MALKYICDRCGKEMPEAGRVVLNFSVSQPHTTPTPKFDQNLCPECYTLFLNAVIAIFAAAVRDGKEGKVAG